MTNDLSQWHFNPALGAKLRRALRLGSATRASEFYLKRAAALRTELASGSLRSARGTRQRRRGGTCSRAHVSCGSVVGLLRFFVELILGRLTHSLSFLRGEVLLKVRRARFAQSGFRVPAYVRADPLAASSALLEITLRLFDRLFKSGVVSLASNSALNLVSAVARARKDSAKHISGRAQKSAGGPGD